MLPIFPIIQNMIDLNNDYKNTEDNKINLVIRLKNELKVTKDEESLIKLIKSIEYLEFMQDLTYMAEYYHNVNSNISGVLRNNFNNTLSNVTNISELSCLDIIISRINYCLIMYNSNKAFNTNILNSLRKNGQVDINLVKEIKNDIYEGSIRICKLDKLYPKYFQPFVNNLQFDSFASHNFIKFLNDLNETILIFFMIFNKSEFINISEITIIKSNVIHALNKINNMEFFVNSSTFIFKFDLIIYLNNFRNLLNFVFGYLTFIENDIRISKAEYNELYFHDQIIYNNYIIATTLDSIYQHSYYNLEKNNNNFYNNEYSEFNKLYYDIYLSNNISKNIKIYNDVRNNLKKVNQKEYNDLIFEIPLQKDLVKQALIEKSNMKDY